EDANGALAFGRYEVTEPRLAEFELEVLAARSAERPVEIDAIGDGGHGGEGIARRPGTIVILKDRCGGIATGIGRVGPGAVIVDGPVQELEMAVGADVVDVEVVGQAHLADMQLKATLRYLRGEGEGRAFGFDEFVSEAYGLMDLYAGEVGL